MPIWIVEMGNLRTQTGNGIRRNSEKSNVTGTYQHLNRHLDKLRSKNKRRLRELGCTVLDPWNPRFHNIIEEAKAVQDWPAQIAAFKEIAGHIGRVNEDMIRS